MNGQPSRAEPGLHYQDRAIVLGFTGAGKSVLLNHLLSLYRCQRLLVDTKGEFAVPDVAPARDPASIDWAQPIVHFVAQPGDVATVEELFDAAWRPGRPLVVCAHELADLCAYQPNQAPASLTRYLAQGRAHGLGLIGGTQRPVRVPMYAKTEAQHVFMVGAQLNPDDHVDVARMMQLPPHELGAVIDQAHAEHGDHAIVWFDRRARTLTYWPPLPPELLASSPVAELHPSG